MTSKQLLTFLTARSVRRGRQAGSAMLVALIVVLTVVLGSVALANRTAGGRLSAAFGGGSREARDIADAGIATVISEFNRQENRKMLVANEPMANWATTNANLRNPCASTTPTATAVAFGSSTNSKSIGNGSFSLVSIEVKSGDRLNRYYTSPTTNTSTGSYNPSLINLNSGSNIGYIEVTVKGTANNGAQAVVTREFQVVPKCCNLSFGSGQSANGNDTRGCGSSFPNMLVGLNGGTITSPGSAAQLRLLDASGNVTSSKPSSFLCDASSTCPASLDGVPVNRAAITIPAVPSYPGSQTNGYSITSTSICETNGTINLNGGGTESCTANQANANDYLRVNPTNGQAELCNTTNTNVSNATSTPILSTSIVTGSCSNAINSFCVTVTDANSNQSMHCRIKDMTVTDDTANTSEAVRRQNNTFVIDSSRMPIYLYFNNAWAATGITTVGGYDDGQIQHVYCSTIPVSTAACATKANPANVARAGIYSDKNINLSIGDDGFVRDLFVYLPYGTLDLHSDPNNYDNAWGMPNFSGAAWINTLSMGANNPTNMTQLAVPPSSSAFYGLGNAGSSASNPFSSITIYEWVARSPSALSLF